MSVVEQPRFLLLALLAVACGEASAPGGLEPEPVTGPYTGSLVAGAQQTGPVGEALPETVELEVRGTGGRPAAGVSIVWTSLAPSHTPRVVVGSSTTDGDGRASLAWTLGEVVGAYELRALHVEGVDTTVLASTTATARPGAPASGEFDEPRIAALAPGDALPLTVLVADRFGNVVPDADIVWLSTQPLVATIDSNVVRAHGEGVATLRTYAGADTLRLDVVVRGGGSSAILHIAFGSCNDEDLPQPLWQDIIDASPDLWVWLGDNIYGDTEDMALLAAKYATLGQYPGYRDLLERMPVIATWDDHDYGRNNAGREYPLRAQSQQVFLDFFGVAEGDERRAREGVYSSHTYGPPGQRVKVILLDVRYHREFPGATADVLGEAQWAWLEQELQESDADVNVIGSGIQIVAEDHIYEKWSRFPAARQRLFRVIGESGARGVLLLSGDRHIGEISRIDGTDAGFPLYDVTSSGLTHSWTTAPEEFNRHRTDGITRELHYGLLRFDWHARTVALQLRDAENRVAFERIVALSDLQ